MLIKACTSLLLLIIPFIIAAVFEETLFVEIGNTIKSRKFTIVDIKIAELDINSSKFRALLAEVYAKKIENFELLNDYAQTSGSVKISYVLLSELWNQMKINNQTRNVYNLIAIYESFSKKIINRNSSTVEMRNNAKWLIYQIRRHIVELTVCDIRLALDENNYIGNLRIRNITEQIRNLNENILDEIIGNVIDDEYRKNGIPDENLIRSLVETNYISQKVTVLTYILKKIQANGDKNSVGVFTIAEYLKKLATQVNENVNLDKFKRKVFSTLDRKLPKLVRHFYFSGMICLRNSLLKEYIFAPNEIGEDGKRNAFTWRHRTIRTGSEFHPISVGGNRFEFENHKFKNEYLYAGVDTHTTSSSVSSHLVYTGDRGGKNSVWQIVLYKNMSFIVNTAYSEFLCVSPEIFSNRKRFLITQPTETTYEQCGWIVEEC